MKRLVIIDAHAVIHRAFHALPPLTAPDGTPVNAAYGFAAVFLKMLRELKPDYAVAAFDHEGPTFRHLAFERYKATRPKVPGELYGQIPLVKEILRAFGVPVVEKAGYEADDLIGTIAAEVARRHPRVETIIVTGDLDTLQLVGPRTKVFTMRKGLSDVVLYDEAAVRTRYGLAPDQIIDLKGLCGDPSDNIPGVKGIGEKTAAELLAAAGSVEGIYRALPKGQLAAKPSVLAALRAHEADALFSKSLATIDRNVPIEFVLAAARLRPTGGEEARGLFGRLGFTSLLARLGGEGAPGAAPPPPAPRPAGREVRVDRVRTPEAVPRRAHAVLLRDPEGARWLVATGPDRAHELPAGARFSPTWFGPGHPTYVFDLKPLLGFGIPHDPARVRDLLLIWWLLEPDRRRYTAEGLMRREGRVASPPTLADVAAGLFAIAPALAARLEREELSRLYGELEAPLVPILAGMEQVGVGFDPRPLLALSRRLGRELGRLEARIHRLAGGPFNINSPRQIAEVLFGRLQFAARGMRRTEKLGAVSTRESELAKLSGEHPIVAEILRFRELAKLKSTYADALPSLAGPDGRLRTTWNQTGTATGRLSSQAPNLQNIPVRGGYAREIRRAFVAARGFTLAAFDYSQLELRIVADLASDEKMIQAFREGLDIHRLTAAEVHDVPLERVTPDLRSRAKALNFGIIYGMGARAFAESAGIPRAEAERFITEYFRDFQGVARFMEETKEFARAKGYTKTAFGRKRFFPEISGTGSRRMAEAERQAVNHPVQGTAADIVKRAMVAVDQYIRAEGPAADVRLLLQIHDELLFELRPAAAERIIPRIKSLMEGVWSGRVPMRVEVTRGQSWGELA